MPTPRSIDAEGIRRTRCKRAGGRVVWLYRVEDSLGGETSKQFDSDKAGRVWANKTREDYMRGATAGKASVLACGLEVCALQKGNAKVHVRNIELAARALHRDGIDDLKDPDFAVKLKLWLNDLKPNWHVGKWTTNEKFLVQSLAELAPSTKHKIARSVRTIVNHAMSKVALGILRDPMTGFKYPAVPQTMKPTFSVDQMRALVGDSFRDHPWWLPMCNLFYTGCRAQEAMHLRWEWIDFEANLIRVQLHPDFDVKFDKPREFPLQPEHREILLRTLHDRPWARRGGHAEGWIIDDEAMRLRGVWQRKRTRSEDIKRDYVRAFRMALRDAKVTAPGCSMHSTRHSFVTMQLAAGISSANLKEWVGHEKEETTLRYGKGRLRYLDAVEGWPATVRRGLTLCLRHHHASAFHNPDEFTEESPVIVVGVGA